MPLPTSLVTKITVAREASAAAIRFSISRPQLLLANIKLDNQRVRQSTTIASKLLSAIAGAHFFIERFGGRDECAAAFDGRRFFESVTAFTAARASADKDYSHRLLRF